MLTGSPLGYGSGLAGSPLDCRADGDVEEEVKPKAEVIKVQNEEQMDTQTNIENIDSAIDGTDILGDLHLAEITDCCLLFFRLLKLLQPS